MLSPDKFNDENRLHHETSLYLRQHRDNPVYWYGWCDAAFDAAKSRNLPVMISIGYAACHWCHVMAHESFEDKATADFINENFIAIKIDREERPDLDALYMKAVTMLGVDGGWPLTVFVNADRVPFWGGTYFPPTPRYGRPSFRQVLQQISDIYHKDPDRISDIAAQMKHALLSAQSVTQSAEPFLPHAPPLPSDAFLAQAVLRLGQIMDFDNGGIAGAPKFPHTNLLELFWRYYLAEGKHLGEGKHDKKYHDIVTISLDKICAGGIYDHLGGGFARYATDETWLVPHFEKMLYDNANMISLLSLVWLETKNPIYARRVEETIGWLQREMVVYDENNKIIGLAASLDADSLDQTGRLHEGAFYTWSLSEIEVILGDDAQAFCQLYDVTAAGNWENRNILNLSHNDETVLNEPNFQQKILTLREKLWLKREKRPRPLRDEKILADWNGLAIAALVRASMAFDRDDWCDFARKIWEIIIEKLRLTDQTDSLRLYHSYNCGRAAHPASLDDYGFMAMAAIELYQATNHATYLQQAEQLAATIEQFYRDDENGGYFFTAKDRYDLIVRQKLMDDNATISGQGAMLHLLASLYYITGKSDYRSKGENLYAILQNQHQNNLLGKASLIMGALRLDYAVQIVIFGDESDLNFQSLWRIACAAPLPDKIIIQGNHTFDRSSPLYGKQAMNGQATVYFCVGQSCSLPIHDKTEFARQLAEITK